MSNPPIIRMGLSVEEAKERLKKMILSIEADANEIVKNIYNETDLECTLQKKSSVLEPKMLIDKEDKKRRKRKLLQIFIAVNTYKNAHHFIVLDAFEDMVKGIRRDALKRIAAGLLRKKHQEHYRAILGALLLQAMCRMLEKVVIVKVRKDDLVIILSIRERVIEQYEHISNLHCKVYVDKTFFDGRDIGALVLFNKLRTVFVDNSIFKRCDQVMNCIRPYIRTKLFKRPLDQEIASLLQKKL